MKRDAVLIGIAVLMAGLAVLNVIAALFEPQGIGQLTRIGWALLAMSALLLILYADER